MKDAYYFPHDSNAKDDPKCVLLIDQLGLEGYGIFWMLIETLRDQPDYKYPLNLLPALARRYNTTAEKVGTVVRSYDLFVIEDDTIFFSESLIGRMIPFENKRAKARKSAQMRWEKCERNANALPMDSERNADAMLSKVNKSKVNTLSRECARENNFDFQLIKQQLLSDSTWMEQACIQSTLGVQFMPMIPDQLDKFFAYIVSIGEEHTVSTLSDAKRRFTHWWQNYGRKEVQSESKQEYIIPD